MKYIELIAKITLLFPICIFLFQKKTREKYRWFLFVYISLFFLEQIAFFISKSFGGVFDWGPFLILPIQLFILLLYFRQLLKSQVHNTIATIIFIIFIIYWIISSIDLLEYNSSVRVSASLVSLIVCMFYYYEEIKRPDSFFIYTKPEFWGVSGIFIFSAGTFFVFLFRQQSLDADKTFFNLYVYIHALLFIVRNLLISVSFLLKSKTQQDISHI